ncbi:hypothetical protein QCA50_006184 [Cerrena zonata]|uniref:Uncharacterized protein n=1 Tax=Cerrena zonata TaxID=2478898 RepID=A0AAW0GNI4_9APHY
MFPAVFLTLALLGQTLALPHSIRADSPGDKDLLLSCPGAAGSPNIRRADRCTLHDVVTNPDKRIWSNVNAPQLNCDGGTQPRTFMIGGETTHTTTITSDVNLGISFEGISIGGGISKSDTTTTTSSNSTTYTIPPGRQVVQTVGVLHHSQTGNIQVNYGVQVDGHYIWYTGAKVTQLTPTDDVQWDTHETKCGTDPSDLNNHS